jgi:hypothetical protein
LAIGGENGFVSTEVQNSTSVLRLKFSAKNPAHRQYAARWVLFFVLTKTRIKDELILSAKAEQNKKQTHNKKIEKKARYCTPY